MKLIQSVFQGATGSSRRLFGPRAVPPLRAKSALADWLFVDTVQPSLEIDRNIGGALAALAAARLERLRSLKR